MSEKENSTKNLKYEKHVMLNSDMIYADDNEFIPEPEFKDMHHALIRAIWNVDRYNPNVSEKLRDLRHEIEIEANDPNMTCDILHEVTGQPIAQATPLLIACFEGEPDVIKLLLEYTIDVNQAESEHHLTPLHVICDADYHGQTLRVGY